MQITLAGEVGIETRAGKVGQSDLRGRRARVALALLTIERRRPVPRDELADLLWSGELPPTWQPALRGTVSTVRACLDAVGLDASAALQSRLGCYQLHLPADTAVDLEVAADAVVEGELAVRVACLGDAMRHARAAERVAARSFLAGEEGSWVEGVRRTLRGVHLRALVVRSVASAGLGDAAQAVAAAEEAVVLEPLREAAHRCLMAAHMAGGDRGGALTAFADCRRLLVDELGVGPGVETEAVYLRVLRDGPLRLPETPAAFAQPASRSCSSSGSIIPPTAARAPAIVTARS